MDKVTFDIVPAFESEEWYQQLIDDCQTIITETEFSARWMLVEGYHALGARILEDEPKMVIGGSDLRQTLSRVSKDMGKGERTLYRAVQFVRKCPDLELLPYGKDVSWRKICHEYLPELKAINEPKPLPSGTFQVIYADPPWPVGSIVMDKWESPIDDKYPTMSIQEIKALPVGDLAGEGCSLFLWTTHKFLPDALDVIKEWGFKYHCLITWDKGNGWTQFGFHKKSEFLLFAYKEHITIDEYGQAIPTVISEPKTVHSKKPDSIRDLILGKTQEPRLEMFARGTYDGWTAWGDEVG